MEPKTLEALHFLTDLFSRHNIAYQVSGGLAAKLYGSERELHDIDVDISEKDFQKIIPEIFQHATFGPARYADGKWDLELITLDYHGQEIDITGAESARISTRDRAAWLPYPGIPFSTIDIPLEGMTLKVMRPERLIAYKMHLDGEHQARDIEAARAYIARNHF